MPFKFKLGKRPARRDYRIPRLSKHANMLPRPPANSNWYADIPEWYMLANDIAGDCTVVACMHGIFQERCYANPGTKIAAPTDAEALATYSAVGGYVQGNEATDRGLFMLGPGGLMEYWAKNGIMCGGTLNKPAAFMQITQPAPIEWEQAISIFGSLLIGIQLPESIVSTENTPFIWEDPNGPVAGGHEVILVGYETVGQEVLFDLISWGKRYRATRNFLLKCMDEAIVVANPCFIDTSGVDPAGIGMAALLADIKAFEAAV